MLKKVNKNIIMLICCSILLSVTGSSIILFSIAGIYISAMRMVGMLCMLVIMIQVMKNPVVNHWKAFLLLLGVYMFITTAFLSPNIRKGLPLLLDYYVCLAVIYLIILTATTKNIYKKYLQFFYIAFLITALICVYEFISGNHVATNYTYGYRGDTLKYLTMAPTAFLYNPNNVGVLMIMSIPMLFLIPEFFGKNKTVLMYGMLILDFIVIFMTGSRGAFVGGILLLSVYMLLSDSKIWVKMLFALLGVGIVLIAQEFLYSQLLYAGMIEDGKLSIFATGDGGRNSLIKNTLEQVFKKNWLFGVGAGGIESITGMFVHNFLVEFMSEFGVFGIIFLGVGLVYVIKEILFIRDKSIRKHMFLILLSFFIAMFVPPTMMTLHFVWVIFALLIAFTQMDKGGN